MKFFVLKILKKVQKERKDHKDTTAKENEVCRLSDAFGVLRSRYRSVSDAP